MLLDIGFKVRPIALVIHDFLAIGANGQQPAQCFDILQCAAELSDQLLVDFILLPNLLGLFLKYYSEMQIW